MKELELAGLDSVRSFLKRKSSRHAPEPGTLCANCETELAGLYCHACGQAADNHHRSVWHLIVEGFEGLFHLDGRLFRTLPPLFFRPGILARDYMQGRIARHVPPFRTFLVSLLLFIFAAESLIHHLQHEARHSAAHAEQGHGESKTKVVWDDAADPETKAEILKSVVAYAAATRDEARAKAKTEYDTDLKTARTAEDKAEVEQAYQKALAKADARYDRVVKDPETAAKEATFSTSDVINLSPEQRRKLAEKIKTEKIIPDNARISGDPQTVRRTADELKLSIAKAVANPELFTLNLFTWGHRLAVLLLPIMSLILGVLYVYRRQFFIFDHFLVSCNILSFMFLTNALGFVLPEAVRGYWFFLLIFWTPVNIFMTLRGAYGSGIFGALIKTLILWWTTMVSFAFLLLWLSWLAATAIAG
jgi:hypothetical protein